MKRFATVVAISASFLLGVAVSAVAQDEHGEQKEVRKEERHEAHEEQRHEAHEERRAEERHVAHEERVAHEEGAWSFGEFQMNIFTRTLDVSTTLPLAALLWWQAIRTSPMAATGSKSDSPGLLDGPTPTTAISISSKAGIFCLMCGTRECGLR